MQIAENQRDTGGPSREFLRLYEGGLDKLIGAQKAQVSRIENGKNLTIATIIKVFKALNLEVKLKIEDVEVEVELSLT